VEEQTAKEELSFEAQMQRHIAEQDRIINELLSTIRNWQDLYRMSCERSDEWQKKFESKN